MSSPMDLQTTADTDSHRGEISFEKKYHEIKQRNQKLMDYVQNQEKEHKTQIQSLKTKLDDSKSTIRKLEDENLALKFQLSGVKDKESQYLKQISEMKSLLRKYYNKVHSNDLSQEVEPVPNRLPLKMKSLRVTTLKPQNTSPTISTQENEKQSPQTAALPRKNRLGIHERKNSACNINLTKKVESASAELDKQRLPQIKIIKSTFSKKNEGASGDSLDDELLSDGSNQGSNLSKESDLKRKADLVLEETKSSLLEDKVRTLNHLPSKLQTPLFDVLDKRPQSLILDNSGFAKTLEHFLEEGYRRKFNMLTQNIVALNMKPEISMKDLEEMRVSRTIGDLDDVNLVRRSFLRYVSKTYPPLDASTPKVRTKSVDKAMPLFQDFFVIGVDRDDINAHIKQNPDKYRANLKPKILYSYPSPISSTNEPPKASVPEFAFPFGVDVKRLKSSPSFSDLNSVLFASNDYELRYKCFVFPLLSSSNLDEQSLMGEVIEKSNPNHLLYIVCINLQDYINMSTSKPDQPKSLKDIKYWQTQKIMCFVTYYPYISFFHDILITFFRILKVEREVKLNEAKSDDITRHGKLDADFTSHYLLNVVQKNLHDMLSKNFFDFGKKYELSIAGSFLDFPVKFHLDEANRASTLEASWACVPVFSFLSLKDLLWFFAAFMLEKKMVFLSKNIFLLTATLSVIRSLIKPFKYPFPLIFNLPEVLMVLCDAPGAALIGINQGEDFLIHENLFEDYPSCIFVCLDEEKVYMDKANKPELAKFENLEKSLLTHYAKLNSNLNYKILDPNKPKTKQAKKPAIKLTSNEELIEKSKKILEVFKTTIEEKIISYIPSTPIYVKDNELDYDKLTEHMLSQIHGNEKPFLNQFLKTQIFTYYLEQHFENNLEQTYGI